MKPHHAFVVLSVFLACTTTVLRKEGGSASGSGGSPPEPPATTGTTATERTGVAAVPDEVAEAGAPEAGEPEPLCPASESASRCDPACEVRDGGACPCDPYQAPNCPGGWWKVCCTGEGAPCERPDIDASVIPACGPGPGPAWCVSYPMPCR